jgi:hypothetical protein
VPGSAIISVKKNEIKEREKNIIKSQTPCQLKGVEKL